MPSKKTKGNAGIMHKRQMEKSLNQGKALVKRKEAEGKGLGGLIQEDNQKNQTVKTAQERRFFFSSSSWHLMQKRA